MKTAIFLYTPEHVHLVKHHFSLNDDAFEVLACGADIELLLEQESIKYRSLKGARTLSTVDRLTYAGTLGEHALRSPRLSFFSHKGVHVGGLLLPALQYYLGNFLYYFNIAEEALKEYTRVIVPSPEIPRGAGIGVLEVWNARACSDAVELVCTQRGIHYERVISPLAIQTLKETVRSQAFTVKRAVFSMALSFFNAFSRVTRRPKPIRILASELWKNIAPLMDALPESELVLLDRAEFFQIGVWRALRHRMRFLHIDQYLTRSMRREATEVAEQWKQEWCTAKEEHLQELEKEVSVKIPFTHLGAVLDYCVALGERLVCDIEAAWAMLERTRPQIVMVRAGISVQTHFAMLCEIARLQGVPSLEVQHGILSGAPHDFSRNPSSEYIAEYGPIVREELEKHAFAPRSTFVDIGSPRFDALALTEPTRASLEGGVFRVLHVGPPLAAGGWNDSYDVADYFTALGRAVREIPNIHIVIKLRASRIGEDFFRKVIARAFEDASYEVALFEPLKELLPNVDAVVSCHSTALLEALLAGKPLVIDATLPIYRSFSRIDLGRHEKEGALIIAESQEQLSTALKKLSMNDAVRAEMVACAEKFMAAHYLLYDGESSSRLAKLVKTLSKEKNQILFD
jgi:hypothetical protein